MVGRRGSQEGAQGSNPPRQRVMPEKTSCSDRAVTAEGSLSFSEPLVAPLQLVSGPGCCPACTEGEQRLSSPALGCLGSLLSFCSLKSLHRLLQSIFLQKRAQRLEIALSLLPLTPAASRRFNPGRDCPPGCWQEPGCPCFDSPPGSSSPP